jgi:Ca-activated chloride channel family protein
MKFRVFLAVSAAAVAVPFLALGQEPQQPPRPAQPVFRTAVDVVSLNITVTDSSNRYVTELADKDFEVYEDGVKQDLILFNRSNLPVALILLMDTSSSMEDRLSLAQDAAVGFVRRLRPADLGEVISFDSRFQTLQKFTNNTADLEAAIRKTVAGGSTSLYNALYVSLKDLKKVPTRSEEDVRRQAIVLLTDGEDTSSLITFDDVMDLARRSETAIYPIGLLADEPAQSKGFREATFALRQMASDTGGRSFFPTDAKSLAGIYSQIYDELSSQYTIGYTSKNARRDGMWRRLVVRVDRPNVIARTKLGYFAPTVAAR